MTAASDVATRQDSSPALRAYTHLSTCGSLIRDYTALTKLVVQRELADDVGYKIAVSQYSELHDTRVFLRLLSKS